MQDDVVCAADCSWLVALVEVVVFPCSGSTRVGLDGRAFGVLVKFHRPGLIMSIIRVEFEARRVDEDRVINM